MISSASMFALGTAAVATTLLPLLLLLVLGAKRRVQLRPLAVGTGAFFVAQILLRLPLLNILSGMSWMQQFTAHRALYAVLIGGLSAGLFEETARWGAAKWLLRENRSYRDAVSFGLGHAFCEVILLTGLNNLGNLFYAILIQSGQIDKLVAILPAVTAEMLVTVLRDTPPIQIYLALLERVSAVLFHLFATCLIFAGLNRKKTRFYYPAAVVAHTLFNAVGSLLGGWNLYAAEAVLFLLALLMGFAAWRMRRNWIGKPAAAGTPPVHPPLR